MLNTRRLTTLAIVAVLAAPAWATDDEDDYAHKKRCTADAETCIHGMVEKLSNRGWIGIEWDENEETPVLSQVVAGSPAQAAGLQPGDILRGFNGVPTSAGEEAVWAEAKKSLIPGNVITLSIERAGEKRDVKVKLGTLPRHVMALWIGNHVIDHHAVMAEAESEAKSEIEAEVEAELETDSEEAPRP